MIALTMCRNDPTYAEAIDSSATFRAVVAEVRDRFMDEAVATGDWLTWAADTRSEAISAKDRASFARIINKLLARLETSHTYFYSLEDPGRYQLLGIFEFLAKEADMETIQYPGIGIDTIEVDGRIHIASIYDGLPAQASDLLVGDEILAVAGQSFKSVASFSGKAGQTVPIKVRRRQDGPPMDIPVTVEMLDPRTMFETAMQDSVRTIEHRGRHIGYVHMWSYAGTKFHDALRALLLYGELTPCDALVLDVRDGWGGASLEYLNLFREPIAITTATSRGGESQIYNGVWGKPVVLLVNERSTSGKELLSYGFKKLNLGPVVGSRTAGAVVAGSPRLLPNGDLLYLAVTDITVDGLRLEGVGITPDRLVERPIPWAAGSDPQLDAAMEAAIDQLASP